MNNTEFIVNPFLNLLNYDSDDLNKLYEEHKNVFIICCKDEELISKEIYHYNIEKDIFNKIKKKFNIS